MALVLGAEVASERILRALARGQSVIRFPRRLLVPLRLLTSLVPRAVFEALAARRLRRR
jgi:hypothetical protein